MGNFFFNGVSAADMGLNVERIPSQYSPRKRIASYAIPGRSGALHQWDGSWENHPIRYECWFKSSPVRAQAHKIKQWLHTAPAGARLEDTYDDTVYHLATYAGGAEIENIRDRFGRFVVEFDCDPRAFLKSGDIVLNITGSGLINNRGFAESFPLIEVTGSTGGTVTINDTVLLVRFPGYDTKTLRVDTYLREAWDITDGGETSMNEWVTGTEFPTLRPGTNTVTIGGGIESIRVFPRSWTL